MLTKFLTNLLGIIAISSCTYGKANMEATFPLFEERFTQSSKESSIREIEVMHVYLGQVGEIPIFYSRTEHSFYKYINGKYVFYKTYNPKYRPLYIDSKIEIYGKVEDEKYCLILQEGESSFEEFQIDRKPLSLVVDSGKRLAYFSEGYDEKIEALDFTTGKVRVLDQIGNVESIVNDNLYFSLIPDPSIIYPNVNLYSLNLETNVVNLVIENIGEESIVVTPDENYIHCYIYKGGGFYKSIYNVSKKSFHILDNPRLEGLIGPYFLDNLKLFVFYDLTSENTASVNVPDNFPYKR